MTASAYTAELSEPNVKALVLEAKKKEVGEQVATAIVNGKDTVKLVEDYLAIINTLTLEEMEDSDAEVYDNVDLTSIIAEELDNSTGLLLYPEAIGNKIGRLRGGDHILVFARPEAGKTATCLSFSGGFARQGAAGIYFGNEDRVRRLLLRQISNLTGLTTKQIREAPEDALARAKQAGMDNVIFISLSPGTPQQVEHYVEKYKPRWCIVDQVRNLFTKSESRTNQLEAVTYAMRNIGKKHDVIMLSVTQAGDSATDKEVLEMNDVDFSNTGMQAQVDVMIGIGMSKSLEEQGLRCLSLPKNKLEGDHGSVIVRIHPFISRISSL